MTGVILIWGLCGLLQWVSGDSLEDVIKIDGSVQAIKELEPDTGRICSDMHELCPKWAAGGHCESTDFKWLMSEFCSVSCNSTCDVSLEGGQVRRVSDGPFHFQSN